jgi:hypothetical protein
MRDTYFSRFPTINYNGYDSINIMSRVKFLDKVYNDNSYYYNIDLPESVRPDLLSNQLYNDPYVSWLIYLSNNVVDPYYDWALNDYDFNNLITEKYGSVSIAQSKIAYWNNNWYDENFLNITISRYNSLTDNAKKYYEPIIENNNLDKKEYKKEDKEYKNKIEKIIEYNKKYNIIDNNNLFTNYGKLVLNIAEIFQISKIEIAILLLDIIAYKYNVNDKVFINLIFFIIFMNNQGVNIKINSNITGHADFLIISSIIPDKYLKIYTLNKVQQKYEIENKNKSTEIDFNIFINDTISIITNDILKYENNSLFYKNKEER